MKRENKLLRNKDDGSGRTQSHKQIQLKISLEKEKGGNTSCCKQEPRQKEQPYEVTRVSHLNN